MIIKRQRIYVDLMDAAVGVPATEIHRQRQEGEGMSTGMKVAGAALAAGGLAFAGHRGYLGGHMMKWTNKGLYKVGNAVGSNTLMNKGAQGYLAGSMKTGGILTGKGAREFYKHGEIGTFKAATAEGAKATDFYQKGYLEGNGFEQIAKRGSTIGETNKALGLGKDNIGQFRMNSIGYVGGTRGVSKVNGEFNTNFDVTTRAKAGADGTSALTIIDARGKGNNVLGTFKTEGTGDNKKSTWNPTQQQTPPQQPAQQSNAAADQAKAAGKSNLTDAEIAMMYRD